MPAPRTPNTKAANETRRQIGLTRAAEKLRAAGWTVIPPDGEEQPADRGDEEPR